MLFINILIIEQSCLVCYVASSQCSRFHENVTDKNVASFKHSQTLLSHKHLLETSEDSQTTKGDCIQVFKTKCSLLLQQKCHKL